jgi:hypothetical protein
MSTILEDIMNKLPHFKVVIDDQDRTPLFRHSSYLQISHREMKG